MTPLTDVVNIDNNSPKSNGNSGWVLARKSIASTIAARIDPAIPLQPLPSPGVSSPDARSASAAYSFAIFVVAAS